MIRVKRAENTRGTSSDSYKTKTKNKLKQKGKTIMKITKTEHFGIQRKIVANMTSQSWHDIPHVSYMYEADATKLVRELKLMNAEREKNNRISLNTLSLKIIAEALKAAPGMNAHIEFDRNLVRGKIDTIEEINISMPMILPNGKMMTVNLHDFGNKSLDEMTAYINDVRRRAENTNLDEAMFEVSLHDTLKGLKKGKIKSAILRLIGSKTGKHKVKSLKGIEKKEYLKIPEDSRLTVKDLEQGTVTISNIGSVAKGINGATALLEIVPPQVSAFAVGSLTEKPVVKTNENGTKEITIATVLPLCIAFDHRALDFGDIVPFLKKLDEIFENPGIIFDWENSGNETEENPKLTIVA